MDCSLTFDDLVALEESDETESVHPNEVKSSVRRQVNNFGKLQSGKDNPEQMKPDTESSETSIQTPTKAITSKKSPQVLKIYNPRIQLPQNLEYGKSISLQKEEDRLHYNPANATLAENPQETPAFPFPTNNNHRSEHKTFENMRQQEYEFQSANQQSNVRDKRYQENLPLNYTLSFATNALRRGNIPRFSPHFRSPIPQIELNTLGYRKNGQFIYYPRFQIPFIPCVPHPSLMNLDGNSRVENNPQDLTKLPNVSDGMRHNSTVNKDKDFLGQYQHPSTGSVNKTEWHESRNLLSATPQIHSVKTYAECSLQNSAVSSTLQKNTERTVLQEVEVKITSDKSVQQKHAEKRAQQKHAEESVPEKYAKKSAQEKNTQLEHVEKNNELGHFENGTRLENGGKSALQENVRKSAPQNADKSTQQDNSSVFTGKGYESIEEFIKALYDNTLYKRY